jgi:hypothetical protein
VEIFPFSNTVHESKYFFCDRIPGSLSEFVSNVSSRNLFPKDFYLSSLRKGEQEGGKGEEGGRSGRRRGRERKRKERKGKEGERRGWLLFVRP